MLVAKNKALLARAFLFIAILIFGWPSFGQYYPRGVRYNDNFLPNLDEPDKLIFIFDGMVDYQKEKDANTNTTYQVNHFHGNIFYGGKKLRGGLQVMQDNSSRDVKDLSVGFGLAFYRPLFIEVGAGYLQRSTQSTDEDGWAINGKVGYEHPIVLQINYRLRIRFMIDINYKTINGNTSDVDVIQFFPLIGIEFET